MLSILLQTFLLLEKNLLKIALKQSFNYLRTSCILFISIAFLK